MSLRQRHWNMGLMRCWDIRYKRTYMQIREVKVYNFGKLEKREFTFVPGINVIYGENEAGKSTLHTFLTAMLFGMDKGRGRKDDYQRYEPWHAPSYYSGAIRFQVEGRPFYLERNFYYKEKREILRNEADGEELSVVYGDLTMLLGGIDKETFGNTYDIPQSGAVTGRELTSMLSEYLSDAAESGERSIHVARAKEILLAKKKALSADLKKLQEEKQRRKQMLLMEQDLLVRDSEGLREKIKKAKKQMLQAETSCRKEVEALEQSCNMQASEEAESLCKDTAECQAGHQKKTTIIGMALVTASLIAMLWNWSSTSQKGIFENGFWMVQGIFAIAMAAGCFLVGKGLSTRRKQKSAMAEVSQKGAAAKVSQTNVAIEALRTERSQAKQMLAMLSESLDEKETRLYNLKEELAALEVPEGKERELTQDIQAVELAAGEIEGLAREFCEDVEDSLNEEVSRYVSAITEGKYDSVRVDEKGELHVLAEGKEVSPDALSRGTLEQFYLALRLAVGNIVMKEETMPIFLDETFVMYDDKRLAQTLKVLAGLNRQVLLFTCQKREMEVLDQLGIPYHSVLLADH